MSSASWRALEAELDRWAEAGRQATFWWRDDDASDDVPALARLLEMAAQHDIPLAVAAIPTQLTGDAARRLSEAPQASVLQHGYAHVNHAPATEKKAEYWAGRPLDIMCAELAAGHAHLAAALAVLPVLVPPWNRIAPALIGHLAAIGLRGLSTYAPRAGAAPAPGLVQVNSHIDLIDWRGTRGFVGEEPALKLTCDHLHARRTERVDSEEPTGLLSHHRMHDEAAWDFLAAFAARVRGHPGVAWPAPPQLFGLSGTGGSP